VIEDRNLRGALVVIFAINKNFHFRINAAYWKKPAEANLNLTGRRRRKETHFNKIRNPTRSS
jgi:hypothetical protein